MKYLKKEEWYCLHRSYKWWHAIYQFQYFASTIFITYNFPSLLKNFVNFFQFFLFSNGLIPIVGERSLSEVTANNTIANYLGYSGISFANILPSALLLWAMITAGVVILVTVIIIITTAIRGGDVGFIVKTKPIYILLRMWELGLFPFAIYVGIHLSHFKYSGICGILGIIVLILLIGYPISMTIIFYIILNNMKKNQGARYPFLPNFKGRYLFIYGFLKFNLLYFVFIPIVKRVLIGFAIGFFIDYPGAQIIISSVICFLYPVLLLLTDSYADNIQAGVETVASIITGVAYLFLFAFYQTNNPNITLLPSAPYLVAFTIVYIILFIASLITMMVGYFVNWIHKYKIFSFQQLMETLKGEIPLEENNNSKR